MGALEKAIDSAMQKTQDEFPIDVFPETISRLIKNAETTVLFNPSLFAGSILSTLATAIGANSSIDNGSFTVRPILWLAIVARSGAQKTAPLGKATEPIKSLDSKMHNEYLDELTAYNSSSDKKDLSKPKFKKFILNDFTIESMVEILSFNERGILITQDELMKWVNDFNKYRGKGGDQQTYLDLWNGNIFSIDRKGGGPIRLEKPSINILGGMQPELLRNFAANRTSDGFLHRFLFVIPENMGPRKYTGNPIDKNLFSDYSKIITNILDFEGQEMSVCTTIKDIYKSWQHKKAEEVHNDDIEFAIQAKMETYIWRFALILEMAHQASNAEFKPELSPETMKKAIRLVEYFFKQALKVHDYMASKDPIDHLSVSQREFYEKLPKKFKRKEGVEIGMSLGFARISADRFLRNHPSLFKTKNRR